MTRRRRSLLLAVLLALTATTLHAQEVSSPSFRISAPTLAPGGYSSSAHYSIQSVILPKALGPAASAGYKLFAGFGYFPFITTPVVSATGGNAQVALTWTAADAALGYTVGSYSVGRSSSSGGPYSFTNVGNVLASTPTGLTNGAPYYFVIRVNDSFGNGIATSSQVSATPTAPAPPPAGDTGGGGGGGGGDSSPPPPVQPTGGASATFSGRAYPGSSVTLLKDAVLAVTTVSGPDSKFQMTASGLSAGSYIFSVYSTDRTGKRSDTQSFPVTLSDNSSTNVSGIFITPTIGVNKDQVKKGDTIAIFGQTANAADVVVQINSDEPHFAQTKADSAGAYLLNFDTSVLEFGDHSAKSKGSTAGEISPYGAAVAFKVGDTTITKDQAKVGVKGDENGDGKVNLVDYSVVAYWYKRSNPPAKADLNGDGVVNLVDFSILAYNWTG